MYYSKLAKPPSGSNGNSVEGNKSGVHHDEHTGIGKRETPDRFTSHDTSPCNERYTSTWVTARSREMESHHVGGIKQNRTWGGRRSKKSISVWFMVTNEAWGSTASGAGGGCIALHCYIICLVYLNGYWGKGKMEAIFCITSRRNQTLFCILWCLVVPVMVISDER